MKHYKRYANSTGYTPGTSTEYNPSNTIPGNNITMKNTPYPVEGIPLDQFGTQLGPATVMYPGMDYQFGNASAVRELPVLQAGAEFSIDDPRSPFYYKPKDNNEFGINSPNSPYYFGDTGIDRSYNQFPNTGYSGTTEQEQLDVNNTNNTESDLPFQFQNPYGGYDVSSSAFLLGQNIKDENALGIAGSGLKLGAGLARNFFSGMGTSNRNSQALDEYNQNLRDEVTKTNQVRSLQEGGEMSQNQDIYGMIAQALQQGADPNQIVEALIQEGITEEEANLLVQEIMQGAQESFQEGGKKKLDPRLKPQDKYLGSNTATFSQDNLTEEGRNNLTAVGKQQEYFRNLPGRALQAADVATDIMQFGAFIPHPAAQAISKVGAVAGAAIDGYQAVDNFIDGDYADSAINALSLAIPAKIGSKVIKSRSKFVQPSHPMYKFSNPSKRVDFIEVLKNQGTHASKVKTNRTLMGAMGTEAAYDIKYQEGGEVGQEGDVYSMVAQALQQGAEPGELVKSLVQEGATEEEATQIVQQVLQQMQQNYEEQEQFKSGGKYTEQLRGKRIINYTLDNTTNEYIVEYED